MTALSEKETTVLTWLASQRDAMIDLVASLVNIDSGTYDKAGVDAVGARLRGFLAAHDIRFRDVANHSFRRRHPRRHRRRGRGRQRPGPAARPSRHRVRAGRGGRRPFRIADGQGVRARLRRHEGGRRDECLRARGVASNSRRRPRRSPRCSPPTRRSARRRRRS